jgi:anhydro-N-acetylmuramic acid kinase
VIERLAEMVRKPERRIVGLMSGTSMDGIDAALVRVAGAGVSTRVRLERFLCHPYEAGLRRRLLHAASGAALPGAEHARLHFEVAASFAAATHAVLRAACVRAGDVDLIGSHGQTLFHQAAGRGRWEPETATWQSGSLPALAVLTGIAAVGDFRSADVALGGTGAPLVPYVDFLLRRSPTESRVLLNLGGIANLTYLQAGGGIDDVLAWDVGPGNMILDAMAEELLGRDCDRDGERAAAGTADAAWLETLLAASYFSRPAPKSAGREEFGADFARRLMAEGRRRGLAADDLLATAVELTARAVALALQQAPLRGNRVDAVYASGGGRRNAHLVRRLQAALGAIPVRGLESLGLDPDAKEAVDFAVLANETLHGHAANLPRVTGAARPCILGSIAVAGLPPRPLAAGGGGS